MTNSRSSWVKLGRFFERGFEVALLLFVGAYRTLGTPLLGGACRFEPSCSEYAVEALKTHRPQKALKLIVTRISKCRPGGSFGLDPVPPPAEKANA